MIEMREIPYWEDSKYLAGSDGNIYSFKRSTNGKIVKPRIGRSKRYLRVNLFVEGKHTTKTIHSLVCAAFHGLPKQGQVVRHINDDKSNNTPSNLAWGSTKENGEDSVKNGKSLYGERNHKAKLTWDDVREIRYLRKTTKKSLREIGELFGIRKAQCSSIVNGKSWKEKR